MQDFASPNSFSKRLGAARIACIYAGFSVLWIIASDAFLRIAVRDSQAQAQIELGKGMAFVLVSSILLYLLLKAWSAPWKNEYASHEDVALRASTRRMLLAFALLTFLVPLLGFTVYKLQAPQTEREAFANLEAIAELKGRQIERWFDFRRRAGVVLMTNDGFIRRAAALRHSNDPAERDYVKGRLEAVRNMQEFEDIALLDERGRLILNLFQEHSHAQSVSAHILEKAFFTGTIQQSDLRIDEAGNLHWSYVVPLFLEKKPVGAVLLHVDPKLFLFPYAHHWPGSTTTGETLLVRRQGDRVMFLNTPASMPNGEDRLHHTQTESNLPAAAAINSGKPGTMRGVDRRGAEVLSAFRPIQGTDWYLVAKLDRSEVLEPLKDLSFWISVVAFFATVAISAAMLLLWRQQRYAQQLAIESKADRLLRHFYDLPFIGMGIASPDLNRWRQCNDRLCEILGYSAEELVSKSWADLSHPDDRDLEAAELELLKCSESDSFQKDKRIVHKDGRVIFASIHVRCVRTTDGEIDFLVVTLQDITERKVNEARIERLSQLYAALSHCNQAIVRSTSQAELFSEICRVAVTFGGMKMAWIGMLDQNGGRIRTASSFGMSGEHLDDIEISANESLSHGKNPVSLAIWENRPVWHADFLNDPSVSEWHGRAERLGWRALAALPLRNGGEAIGVFALYTKEPYGFDQAVRDLLVEMMNDIEFALDNFAREEARQHAESQLLLAAKVFEQSSEGFMITDAENRIVLINRAFTDITGYGEDEILGKNPSVLSSGHQKMDFYRGMWEAISVDGYWQGEVLNRRKNGSLYLEWLSISRVLDHDERVVQHIGIFSDITERRANEERVDWLLHFDSLTGLPNRTLLDDRCRQAISMEQRNGTGLTLMFLDLDNFKYINDSLGYRIGDALLAMLSERLQRSLREQDTISRVGGDDFIIVLPGTDADSATHVAEKLLAELARSFKVEEHELSVTASIGIAVYPDNGEELDSLSRCAEAAMYRAKQDGRNTFRFFAREMQEQAIRTLQIESGLRRALERNQLKLHYQPQISLESGRIFGVEALLRWENAEFGQVFPTEFIPIAESSGMILPIGEWVLNTAVRQMKSWLDMGLKLTTMAVNLSAIQFRHPRLPEQIMQILEDTGLPSHHLELELTESAAMEDPVSAMAVVRQLCERGVRVSIDDFGTGHSSLGHLKRFNAYKLKIDRSFVRDIASDPDDRAIVGAIINMADSLGIKTIAEGVETEEQLDFLRLHGCQEVQGFYFGKPVPADQFERMLREKAPAI